MSVEALEKKCLYQDAVCLLKLLLGQVTYCSRSRGALWERLAIDTERYLKDSEKVILRLLIKLYSCNASNRYCNKKL